MCPLRLLWRAVALLTVFIAVGLATSHLVIAQALAHGAKIYEVRLAGFMAGLFAGGAATALAGLAIVMEARRGGRRRELDPDPAADHTTD